MNASLLRRPEPLPTRACCRFCKAALRVAMVDPGMSPIANDCRKAKQPDRMTPFHPLRAPVCEQCLITPAPTRAPPAVARPSETTT